MSLSAPDNEVVLEFLLTPQETYVRTMYWSRLNEAILVGGLGMWSCEVCKKFKKLFRSGQSDTSFIYLEHCFQYICIYHIRIYA